MSDMNSICIALSKQWQGQPYGNLSLVLVFLRYLALVHQTNHHVAKGDMFYGDHLLFERLYNAVSPEIDLVAEKAVGMGTAQNVDLFKQAQQLNQLVQNHKITQRDIPTPTDLAMSSLIAENLFLSAIEHANQTFTAQSKLTKGIDNMLAQIVDTHEGHVYLLKQRVAF